MKDKQLLKAILLCFLMNTIGYSQSAVLNLKYSQAVIEDGKKKPQSERAGFMNIFNPSLFTFTETNENMEVNVQVQKDTIYIQTQLADTDEIFSTKYQVANEMYYLNLLTGEKEKFQYSTRLYNTKELLDKLKVQKKKLTEENGWLIEYYKANVGQKEMRLKVCGDVKIDPQSGVFNEYFKDGKLIVEKRVLDKEKKKEIVLTLVSIDTLSQSENLSETIRISQELVLANQNLLLDSISFGVEIPDIYYKSVGEEKVVSLKKYKGNGKYLLIDFWGTWCKPCLASIPELKLFYGKYSDQVDLINMDFKDSNLDQIKLKIAETGMYWEQGILTKKVNKILNPASLFPGVIMFDDEMKLILRDNSKAGLETARRILENK